MLIETMTSASGNRKLNLRSFSSPSRCLHPPQYVNHSIANLATDYKHLYVLCYSLCIRKLWQTWAYQTRDFQTHATITQFGNNKMCVVYEPSQCLPMRRTTSIQLVKHSKIETDACCRFARVNQNNFFSLINPLWRVAWHTETARVPCRWYVKTNRLKSKRDGNFIKVILYVMRCTVNVRWKCIRILRILPISLSFIRFPTKIILKFFY